MAWRLLAAVSGHPPCRLPSEPPTFQLDQQQVDQLVVIDAATPHVVCPAIHTGRLPVTTSPRLWVGSCSTTASSDRHRMVFSAAASSTDPAIVDDLRSRQDIDRVIPTDLSAIRFPSLLGSVTAPVLKIGSSEYFVRTSSSA